MCLFDNESAVAGVLGVTMKAPHALIVAYCFPPHGAIGTHRTLRLVQCLSRTGWSIDIVTADASSYMPGTPVDSALTQRVPDGVRVRRDGRQRRHEDLRR